VRSTNSVWRRRVSAQEPSCMGSASRREPS
jgi:hypothetical protein